MPCLFCLVFFFRDGRYDLADFFYEEAYREGAVSHWQEQPQQHQGQQQQQQQEGEEEEEEAQEGCSRVEPEAAAAAAAPRGGEQGNVNVSVRGGGRRRKEYLSGVEAGVMDLHGHSLPLAHAAVRLVVLGSPSR